MNISKVIVQVAAVAAAIMATVVVIVIALFTTAVSLNKVTPDAVLCSPLTSMTLTTLIFRGSPEDQTAFEGHALGSKVVAVGDGILNKDSMVAPPCTGRMFPQEKRFCEVRSKQAFNRGVAQAITALMKNTVSRGAFLLVLSPTAAKRVDNAVRFARCLFTANAGRLISSPASWCGMTNAGVCNLDCAGFGNAKEFGARYHAQPLECLLLRNVPEVHEFLNMWHANCMIPGRVLPTCCEKFRSRSGDHDGAAATFNATLFAMKEKFDAPGSCWVSPTCGSVVRGAPIPIFTLLRRLILEPAIRSRSAADTCHHETESVRVVTGRLDKANLTAPDPDNAQEMSRFVSAELPAMAGVLIHRPCVAPDEFAPSPPRVGTAPMLMKGGGADGRLFVWCCVSGAAKGLVVVDDREDAPNEWMVAMQKSPSMSKTTITDRWISMTIAVD